MRLKIFTCHHRRPERIVRTEIFDALVSNHRPVDGEFLTDLDGVNISTDNLFSEMRLHYYIWRNRIDEFDYVGFEHYRRCFFIDPFDAARQRAEFPLVFAQRLHHARNLEQWHTRMPDECFHQYLDMREAFDDRDIARVKHWVSKFEIITMRPEMNYGILEQWNQHHPPELYAPVLDTLRRHSRFWGTQPLFDNDLHGQRYCNMFIMSRAAFIDYMTFWAEAINLLKPQFATPISRLWGFLSERIFSLYVQHRLALDPLYPVATLPMLMMNEKQPEVID